MSIPADTTDSTPAPRRGRRRFQILIGVVITLCVLWTVGWFAIRHYAAGKINFVEQAVAAEGGTFTCGQKSIAGYPFKLDVTCTPVIAACPADEVSLELTGIEAIGLIYNPGHAIFALKGPMTLQGPRGTTLDANWTSLQSSVRVGLDGLKRSSVVADGVDATLRYPEKFAAPVGARAQHAEFHMLQNSASADALDLFLTLDQFTAALPDKPALPPITSRIAATVPKAMVKQGGDPAEAWIDSGAPITIQQLDFTMAGVTTSLSGELTAAADGLVSGKLTVRVDALDKLPDLAETLHPGSRDKVSKLIGPIAAFLKPVTIDGRQWREASIAIKNGRAALGFIPLGVIPPLRPAPPAPEPAPAPAETPMAAAPAAPEPPAASPSPESAPASTMVADAQDAARKLGAMQPAVPFVRKRCAIQ